MVITQFIKARVPATLKQRVVIAAQRQLVSESVWLKRLVLQELQSVDGSAVAVQAGLTLAVSDARRERGRRADLGRSSRLYIRLRREDLQLLEARAAGRGLRPATYVSILTRSHLRQLTPLPKEELLALKRSISELSAIGRNLNQIAKVANDGGRLPGSVPEFRAMLKICEALRDNTKALIKANVASWSSGYGQNG
jgi:hypothetical protein